MRWFVALFLLLLLGARAAAAPPALVGALDAPEFWQAYKQAFISPGGRVIDNANGDISHSEGQGYGMLLAVAANDPATFEALWTWTRAQLMLRDDGLPSWKWDPAANPHLADRNNATDGDVLIAWALAEAGEAWSQTAYKTAALRLVRAIVQHDIAESSFGLLLRASTAGFGPADRADGPVVNLSYWVFPAFARLSVLVPERSWALLRTSGLRLLEVARFGAMQLPSDWISVAGPTPKIAKGFPPTFGYDAIRIPLYLAWAGLGDAKTLASFAPLFSDANAVPLRTDLSSGQTFEPFGDSGYRAIGALTRCALHGALIPADLREPAVDRYYPSTLRALVLIAVQQTYPACR